MPKNVVLGISGSIAAYKSLQIVTDLKKKGIKVVVIMTESAQKFITPLSFKSLSQNEVITDLFAEHSVRDPIHIALSSNVDLIVVAPASANIIAKMAAGMADDALTCTVMASSSPKIVAPAMEDKMYTNSIVQDNIQKLKKNGFKFIGPVSGRLASGREAIGRMADVDVVVNGIMDELGKTNI